ncbi:hypothetical protein DIJ64_05795 [Mycobacterium leprae]|uniref:Uncharacterized protein n=1 Tax=Mycobacterium leprae TaxID=1769 RepID=A0AAD0KRM7_MYCLR|nr:hypothetical protein DIJ64_05795 [Mycobacterium leprae]OAR21195.1 hypothetical protein A8144_07440 [Mycobacterium leprae 3125609]OAX71099.1 hypothetical protein A3216_07940 [Mycobacterium leprae 7935681]
MVNTSGAGAAWPDAGGVNLKPDSTSQAGHQHRRCMQSRGSGGNGGTDSNDCLTPGDTGEPGGFGFAGNGGAGCLSGLGSLFIGNDGLRDGTGERREPPVVSATTGDRRLARNRP